MFPKMTPEEFEKRWEGIASELIRRKRLDPTIYENVVSALARLQLPSPEPGDPAKKPVDPDSTDSNPPSRY